MQGYHTIEEAAQFLSMSVDDLRNMAQRNQIRSFQDRGTLRFRDQDIRELARQRGMASDVDQPLGGPPMSPRSPRKSQLGFPFHESDSSAARKRSQEDFSLTDDQVDIGRESSSGSAQKSDGKKSPSKPKLGSDSDVRLISDQDVSLNIGSDSDIKLVSPDSNVNVPSSSSRRHGQSALGSTPPSRPRPPVSPPPTTAGPPTPNKGVPGSSGRIRSKLEPPSSGKSKTALSPSPQRKSMLGVNPMTPSPITPDDEDARLILADSDSDVKIVGAGSDEMSLGKSPLGPTDSDIRLEGQNPRIPSGSDEGMLLTEEINLDEEIRKQDEALKKQVPRLKGKSKFPPEGPGVSKTELGHALVPMEPSSSGRLGHVSRTELGRAPGPGAGHPKTELGQVPKPRVKSKLDLPPQQSKTELGKAPAHGVQPRTELGKVPPPQGTQPKTELGQVPRGRGQSRLDLPPTQPRTELGKPLVPGTPSKTELGQVPRGRVKSRLDTGPVQGQQPRTELGKPLVPGTPPKTELGQVPKGRVRSRLDTGPVQGQQPRTELGKPLVPGTPKTELGQVPKGRVKSKLDAPTGKTELGVPKLRKSKLADPGQIGKTEMRRAAGLPSPFELSDDSSGEGSDPLFLEPHRDSSDFDLVPTGDGNVQLQSDDDFSLDLPEEVGLGNDSSSYELQGPTSGINLANPIDAGISLEPHDQFVDSSSEFELSLDDSSGEVPSQQTSALADSSDFNMGSSPSAAGVPDMEESPSDSDSEFELSLESSEELPAAAPPVEVGESGSEFELNLDSSSDEVPALEEGSPTEDSDSEFELTLDDSGNLATDQTEAGANQDRDIFETDDDMPGLEDESGSQVAELETELESSEFEIESDEESGSAVVALDEDDLEEPDEPAARPSRKSRPSRPASKPASRSQSRPAAFDEEILDDSGLEEFDQLDNGLEYANDEPMRVAAGPGPARIARPAPWGVLPTVFMLPCLVIMIAVGLVSFDLAKSSDGYRPPGPIAKFVGDLLNLQMK